MKRFLIFMFLFPFISTVPMDVNPLKSNPVPVDPSVHQITNQRNLFEKHFPNLDAERFFRVREKLEERVEDEYPEVASDRIAMIDPLLEGVQPQVNKKSIAYVNSKSGLSDILLEGDMLPSTYLLDEIEHSLDSSNVTRSKRQAINIHSKFYSRWAGGIVYYSYAPNLPQVSKKSFEFAAKNFWEPQTCLKFKESNVAKNRIKVIHDDGCYSDIGSVGGVQTLSLGDGCDRAARHEIGHALGLHHTQSRYDRDQWVTVRLGNVERNNRFNYAKETPRTNYNYGIGYDYGSTMHYSADSFIVNPKGQLPMIPKENAFMYTMGNDQGSFNDILMVNKLYRCEAICAKHPKAAKCVNGGIPNPKNCAKCICPKGYAGLTCGQPQNDLCGQIIQATSRTKILKRLIGAAQPPLQYVNKECTVHIKAPPGKRVEVVVKKIGNGDCYLGCEYSGMEFKIRKDPRFRGLLYCCPGHVGKKMVSLNNVMPVIFYSQSGVRNFEITYRAILVRTGRVLDNYRRTPVKQRMRVSEQANSGSSKFSALYSMDQYNLISIVYIVLCGVPSILLHLLALCIVKANDKMSFTVKVYLITTHCLPIFGDSLLLFWCAPCLWKNFCIADGILFNINRLLGYLNTSISMSTLFLQMALSINRFFASSFNGTYYATVSKYPIRQLVAIMVVNFAYMSGLMLPNVGFVFYPPFYDWSIDDKAIGYLYMFYICGIGPLMFWALMFCMDSVMLLSLRRRLVSVTHGLEILIVLAYSVYASNFAVAQEMTAFSVSLLTRGIYFGNSFITSLSALYFYRLKGKQTSSRMISVISTTKQNATKR